MSLEQFSFEVEGKKYKIPHFGQIPMGAIRKARKGSDDADQVFIILEIVMGEDSKELAAVDRLNATDFAEFIQNWTQGAPLGESSSSES
jgi:hypothetical protein